MESITQGAGYQADYCTDDKAARHAQCADKPDGCMGDEIYFRSVDNPAAPPVPLLRVKKGFLISFFFFNLRKEGSYYVNTTVEDAAKECRSFNPST